VSFDKGQFDANLSLLKERFEGLKKGGKCFSRSILDFLKAIKFVD